jgi:hypothetical protein
MDTTGRTPTDHLQPDDTYQEDLHPDFGAGVNAGPRRSQELEIWINADEIKQMHDWLPELTDALLKQIPVIPLGARLKQGATYLDLADPQRRPFTAQGGMVADLDHYCVPKEHVDYVLWNVLTGVETAAWLDQPDATGESSVGDASTPAGVADAADVTTHGDASQEIR